jgi:hypothetical protein
MDHKDFTAVCISKPCPREGAVCIHSQLSKIHYRNLYTSAVS